MAFFQWAEQICITGNNTLHLYTVKAMQHNLSPHLNFQSQEGQVSLWSCKSSPDLILVLSICDTGFWQGTRDTYTCINYTVLQILWVELIPDLICHQLGHWEQRKLWNLAKVCHSILISNSVLWIVLPPYPHFWNQDVYIQNTQKHVIRRRIHYHNSSELSRRHVDPQVSRLCPQCLCNNSYCSYFQ